MTRARTMSGPDVGVGGRTIPRALSPVMTVRSSTVSPREFRELTPEVPPEINLNNFSINSSNNSNNINITGPSPYAATTPPPPVIVPAQGLPLSGPYLKAMSNSRQSTSGHLYLTRNVSSTRPSVTTSDRESGYESPNEINQDNEINQLDQIHQINEIKIVD